MAVIQQGVETVFETDTFAPLMALGRELAAEDPDERALRILADHSRAMTFLIADGVVPSNEDRGYILRRIMRRAIQQGHRIGIAPGFMPTFAEQVIEIMGAAYPELERERDAILLWARSEEEGFGRTLEQGTKLLDEVIERVAAPSRHDPGEDAFRCTTRSAFRSSSRASSPPSRASTVDTAGFDALMEDQRALAPRAAARARRRRARRALRERARELARAAGFQTDFTGYETLEQHTTVGVARAADGDRVLVKLAESPFYATGGGQVADVGVDRVRGRRLRARASSTSCASATTRRSSSRSTRRAAAPASASSRASTAPRAPRRRPTTPRRTSCTPRCASASARTCARPAPTSGPTSCASTSATASGSRAEDLQTIEDRVNEWILRNDPVRPITTTLDEARALGAMALFGEKYGDVVRMVQIGDGDYSRELCGGTHVRSTAEIGVFKLSARARARPTCAASRRSPGRRRSPRCAAPTPRRARPRRC